MNHDIYNIHIEDIDNFMGWGCIALQSVTFQWCRSWRSSGAFSHLWRVFNRRRRPPKIGEMVYPHGMTIPESNLRNGLKHVETCWNMLKHVETCWNHMKPAIFHRWARRGMTCRYVCRLWGLQRQQGVMWPTGRVHVMLEWNTDWY